MAKNELFSEIVDYVAAKMRAGSSGVSAGELEAHIGSPRSTLNRDLALLVRSERLEKFGGGRSVAYRIPEARTLSMVTAHEPVQPPHQKNGPIWSENAKSLLADLSQPLGTRKPISYQRSFVDSYTPNKSSLLPAALAAELFDAGRSKDQQPAGTYARRVLEQLLIDLSWFSSRLEGNRKSMLDTRELFEKGRSASDDKDATMLLNHKDTIEFMVEAVPTEGMTVPVVRNIQSLLMRELLADPTDLGDIRKKIVNIQDTAYIPCQVPDILLEMLEQIIEKAEPVRNFV